ncbi:hypothetical protein ACFLT5_00645 [Chloroflexota bacterium]
MEFTRVGDLCPNGSCPDYEGIQSDQQRNVKKASKTKTGRQRYQCKTCKQTFVETKGTILYRRRTPEEEIIETSAFIAEGVRISSLARVKGHKEDTILDGLRTAAQQADAIEEILSADYQLDQGQLD